MRPNRLRQLLDAGLPSIATHVHSMWPDIVEVLGHTGMFDYVEFTGEYAPYNLFSLENFCRAVELFDMSAIIKVDQEPRSFLAQRAVGCGFQGVLFADCRSVEEVRRCVDTCRPDTPEYGGTYGATVRRITYMDDIATPDYVQAIADVVVLLMVEKRPLVENLEEALSVEGVDMIQWGPADYGLSIGHPGQWDLAEVKATERRVIETALRMGVQPRAEINSADEAKYYLDLGVSHFCIGTDLFILYDWWKTNGEELRRAIEGG
jgi:4-hydroxy-2-oxoheptanedioate aldolase